MGLQILEVRGIRVLTSAQIAECYETTRDRIKQNFKENKMRFMEGKHYIALVGDELRAFKNEVGKYDLLEIDTQNEVRIHHPVEVKAKYQFDTKFKYAKSLYLWTEKGALLHAKSLNTDKAWEVYDYLVDFYFRVKGKAPDIQPPAPKTYREMREASLAEIRKKEAAKRQSELQAQLGYDIAPMFRELISQLPIEALDEMEKCFRGGNAQAIKLAATSILAEKMKRQLA